MPGGPAVIGRYEVQTVLGQGGMGTLYLARDPVLGRLVALKVLRDPESDELRALFLREARTAANLRHTNIIGIHDLGEFEGGLYMAMEYLEGQTVGDMIQRRTPIALVRKLQIVAELCLGLAYAHGAGVVHRDVKPNNVMVDRDGRVVLVDFGIAGVADSQAVAGGMLIGTPGYMAPEQIQGHADMRSDVYSAGAVLYELIAMRPPFPGNSSDVLTRILHEGPAPIESVVPGLDPDIAAIVRRAMARDPAERYQDIGAMAEEIERVRARLSANGAAAVIETVGSIPAPEPRDSADRTMIMALPPSAARAPAPDAPDAIGSQTVVLTPAAVAAAQSGAMPAVQIVIARSGDARRRGHVMPMTGPSFTIGRDAACELRLDDPTLSRRHAVIEYGAAGFRIRELSSTNGTYVNGRRVKSGATEPLFFGASIELGDTVLTFALTSEVKLPDLTGCRIAGRYELRTLIRDSAKGAVYAGHDTRVDKDIAVKLLSPELMRLDDYREQFDREAAIGATLHHPHICQVLDRGEDDVQPPGGQALRLKYLCLEMMGGGSLQHRLRKGPLPLEEASLYIERVADALEYSHRHGVVHGDVKASAVVFSHDGHVYLTDFAFAQRALQATDGPSLGSPAYMAPEIWDHGHITPAADQFALGAVAYYAVAGTLPFAGQESPAVRRTNFMRGPVPVHQEAANARTDVVPPATSAVLARALARDPAQRFASTTEFAAAFTAALKGRRSDRSAPHIFLSYQRDMSAGWANYFARELKDQGIATFLDVQRIDRAQQFPERLARAIEECDVFVCLLGATTLQSAWVIEEIRQAHRHGKPMIPVFQESFDPSAPRPASDPAVDALLAFDAVHLFDVRNVHVQHSAADLATLVKNTVARS